jgi:hypothetical protein
MPDLKKDLERIRRDGERYFAESVRALEDAKISMGHLLYATRDPWELVPEALQHTAEVLRQHVVQVGSQILDAARTSSLLTAADASDIRLGLRRMTSALRFREFQHSAAYPVTEEDRVYGMVPEEQHEHRTFAEYAANHFQRAINALSEKLIFIVPTREELPRAIVASEISAVRRYRPNTAFIMMQINPEIPKLEDVKCCIKGVFKDFGVEAVRSDEIEHQDVLTQRILDEIATSEFLVADLTGERPSVYYEVGFAHAVGKRPILYREKGTRLHFDLSVHNVPEYENITDLKNKLTKRLEALTNRSAN